MSDIEIGSENDRSVRGDEQDDSYIAGSTNVLGHTSPVNPIIWKPISDSNDEMIPYLMFAPHCENCGKPVEFFEGVPYWCIYPLQRFLCAECEDLDYGYFLYKYRKLQSGEWTKEQAEAFVMSLYNDEGPYYF